MMHNLNYYNYILHLLSLICVQHIFLTTSILLPLKKEFVSLLQTIEQTGCGPAEYVGTPAGQDLGTNMSQSGTWQIDLLNISSPTEKMVQYFS